MSSSADAPLQLERWSPDHPRTRDVRAAAEALGHLRYLEFSADWHLSSHRLVALRAGDVIGFLRFVVQEIGPDDDLPPVRFRGAALTEAKILAFGVLEEFRGEGVGARLQGAALAWARELGCHQVRSRSDGPNRANHHLKLALGFAVHPAPRVDDARSAYFVMPLRAAPDPGEDA